MKYNLNRKVLSLILALGFVSIAFYSCKDDEPPVAKPDPIELTKCDSMNAVYANDIETIINTNCGNGYCHGGGVKPKLNNYDSLVSAVNNYGLLDAISHNPGRSPMPKNGNKLDDSTIQRISCWIENGMKK